MIRKFLPEDAEQVSALIQNTLIVSNSADYHVRPIRRLSHLFAPPMLRSLIKRREIYVFERTGRLCGTISLEDDRVYSFFVAPDRQGTGIGKALLKHIEKRARKRGVRTLRVASSLTAVSFYEKMGFTVVGQKDDESYGETVMMVKSLGPR
jgi:GNAT superfamily N-acetyltransferase